MSLSLGGTAAGGSYGIGYLINGKGGRKSRTLVRRNAENGGTDSHSSPTEKGESGPKATRNDNHEASSRASNVSTGTEDSGATNSGSHSTQTQSNLGGGNNLRSEESISTSISLNRERKIGAEVIYPKYITSGEADCRQWIFERDSKKQQTVNVSSCKDLKSEFWKSKNNENPVFWLRTTQEKILEILREYKSFLGEEIETLISGSKQDFQYESLKCSKNTQDDGDVVVSCHGKVNLNNPENDDEEDED